MGCSSDDECPFTQACRNRACVNPCATDNPCSSTAECTVNSHRAVCKCPPGFTGDPYSRCVPSKLDTLVRLRTRNKISFAILVQRGECQYDRDCPDNRACIENQCLDPCILDDPCGKNAQCQTTSHRPVCRCPSGWAGDPHTECYQCRFRSRPKVDQLFQPSNFNFLDECQVDNDCPLDKACKSQECVDPCLTTICGTRAQCEVDFHTAICVCPPGLQGNPLVACIEAGCSSNPDCATTEICDFVPGSGFTRKECQPLCRPGNCAQGAECSARDHREICTCRYPLIGDGHVSCVERKW